MVLQWYPSASSRNDNLRRNLWRPCRHRLRWNTIYQARCGRCNFRGLRSQRPPASSNSSYFILNYSLLDRDLVRVQPKQEFDSPPRKVANTKVGRISRWQLTPTQLLFNIKKREDGL